MNFTERETATMLAALRFWQANQESADEEEKELVEKSFFQEETPLSSEEIDLLCEQINCGKESFGLSWSLEDVAQAIMMFEVNDPTTYQVEISNKDAREVLEMVERKADANLGISWEIIHFWAEELKEEGKISYQVIEREPSA